MLPIGRRRRWRDVVERAQFHAQLRQLRDPVAGDNIGMALTEVLHHAVESSDPLIILSILPSRLMVLPTPTKRPILLWESFLQRTARLDEMLATLAGKLNSNESFNPDRVSKWMWCLCPCQVRAQVEVENTILDVDAWIEKTRKNNVSSPSKTEMPYVVLAPLSPCERTATKIKAWMGLANGTI